MSYVYRYGRWDGTQQVFELDEDLLMDQLADDVMMHGDVSRALRNFMRRGFRGDQGDNLEGLRQMMERLREQRRQNLERYNLDSVFQDIKERLEQVVSTEREGVDKRLQEAREKAAQRREEDPREIQELLKMLEERANRSRDRLDNLPDSPAGAIQELRDHDFMDPEARRQFQELLDVLQQQMLQNYFQGMKQQMQGMTPGQMAGIREMLRDLNQMLQDRAMGREPNFQGFMDRYGSMFGEDRPGNLDELMENLARQMAQMQSLLDSMSPEMRRELEDLADSLLDVETMDELAQLAAAMEQMYPMEDLRDQYQFLGDEPLTMAQAMDLMRDLQNVDDLERQLRNVLDRGNIDDVDMEKLEEMLGEEARRTLETLKNAARKLEEAGYVKRSGSRLEMTPRGMRKLGQKVLQEVFSRLKKDRFGEHELHSRGLSGEESGETKPHQFGDPFDLNLNRTVMNAITRSGPQKPVRLIPEDFEINRKEEVTRTSTCLLLDQSRSMGMFGSFLAAKKVAIGLYTLVQSQFRKDKLYVIGFSDQAIELKGEDLHEASWNSWLSGTNMHDAFMMSRRLLSREKGGTRQIIMITDGEPTAHMEDGRTYFAYPPSPRTIHETLKEVKRCTQEGIVINTFMLESSYYLLDFVDRMTRINKGRAFYTTPDRLGEFVLVDYLSSRRRRVA